MGWLKLSALIVIGTSHQKKPDQKKDFIVLLKTVLLFCNTATSIFVKSKGRWLYVIDPGVTLWYTPLKVLVANG